MVDPEREQGEVGLAQFTQAGSMEDLSLNQLRDHIKRVMIPLLIKSFQLKLELSQAISLPSRLQAARQKQSSEEIISQLKQLDKDLQVLVLWCQSCRNQVQKSLVLPEEENKSLATPQMTSIANPAVSKSFSEAIGGSGTLCSSSTTFPSVSEQRQKGEEKSKRKWWKRFLNQ